MTEETPGHPGQNAPEFTPVGLDHPDVFFVVERRIYGDDEIMVVGAKNQRLALATYRTLIDQSLAAPTYLVRAYRVPMPADMDPMDVKRAAEESMKLCVGEFKRAGVEQIAAFARLENDVIVDMNLIAPPHLANMAWDEVQ